MAAFVEGVFRSVLNMSITASIVISAVMIMRLFLRRAPKWICCGFWFVALFRLLCPVSFTSAISAFGLIGSGSSRIHIPLNLGAAEEPWMSPIVPIVTGAVTAPLRAATPDVTPNPLQSMLSPAAVIWVLGLLTLLAYSSVSYLLLKRRISTATVIRGNVYQTDRISVPFVCGVSGPRIYLPISLKDGERDYIIRHEQMHIRRGDCLVKPIWFLAVCLHWFNPLAWLSFHLMSNDMEMSCDEAVIRDMGEGIKADYSTSLLTFSAPRRLLTGSPLAFGETSVLARVKNVLSYRRPRFGVVLAAVAAVITASFVLASNPRGPATEPDRAKQLLQQKTPYVGDNSKVGRILSLLRFPEGVAYSSFALQTQFEPYEVTAKLKTSPTLREYYADASRQQTFEQDAVIMFSLISNVEVIHFHLTDGDDGNSLKLVYTRDSANRQYGRDVRLFSESEAALAKLLYSQPATEPAQREAVYTLTKLGKDGKMLATRLALNRRERDLLDKTIFNYMVKSAAWPGVSIRTLDESYVIRISYPDDTAGREYYCFTLDGKAFMQHGEEGMHSRIDDELYKALVRLIETQTEAGRVVEKNLAIIMSSPAHSSNPGDYIRAHPDDYDSILKLGDEALSYMLSCFRSGEGDTLKAHIMMLLSQQLLGARTSPTAQGLSPSAWYAQLKIRQ